MSASQGSEGVAASKELASSIWSLTSLDAVLVALWTIIIGGALLSIVLDMYVSAYYKELAAQLSVVAFILMSAYRAGVNNKVDALTWYTSAYVTILFFSVFIRRRDVAPDLFIEHVFYAMMAFVCLLGAVKIYRHYFVKKKKKPKVPVAKSD